MYDIFTKQTLYDAHEKATAQILSRASDNLIKKAIFHENANQYLVVFIVGKHDLIFYYVYGGQREDDGEYIRSQESRSKESRSQDSRSAGRPQDSPPQRPANRATSQPTNTVIRRFPTIKEHGEIRDICFNSSGDNIYILFEEGIIVCLSVLELTEQLQQQLHGKRAGGALDLDASLICTKSICSPTNIIVWYSFDGQQEIAIIGNQLGELCFVNVDKRQIIIKRTSIKKPIKNLRIIRDKFTVTLLITAADNSQLKLPLEENRLSLILNQDNDADNIRFMEENKFKLFSCFIVYNGAQQPEIDEEKIRPVPVQIELRKHKSCSSTGNLAGANHLLNSFASGNLLLNHGDEKLNCILINQQSFILATHYHENGNLASINIFEGNEFDYEFTTPLSKYCFPRECVSLENIIELVTERLIITANANVLFVISKQCSDFRRENIEYNSIISSIEFDSRILSVFRLNENQIDNYLDTLIVVTSQCAYKLRPKMSCESIFTELLSFGGQMAGTNQLSGAGHAFGSPIGNSLGSSLGSSIGKPLAGKLRSTAGSLIGTPPNPAHEFAFMLRLNLNTLYKRTTHHFLQNKQYQKVLELFQSEHISKLELIKNFLTYGYLNEAINIISHLFEEKNYDLDDQDKVSFANVYVACSIQRILEKRVMNEKNVSKLKQFLLSNIYYNEQYVIKLLIGSYMFELATLCAAIRNNYACLIRNLLNVEQVQRELLKSDFYDQISQSIYADTLTEPFRSADYFECLLATDSLQGFFLESDLISTYLKLLIETLPKLNDRLLKRASRLFDPRQPQVQIFLNNVVSKLSPKYMCYASSPADDRMSVIQKKDVVNFFIFINLMILKNQRQNGQFDRRILGLLQSRKASDSGLDNELEYNRSPTEQDYQVTAGQSRGFLVKHGRLFGWGSAKFGADAEVHINCNKQSFEPKLNGYFSEQLAIKVISVSSGAYHTLILTKISCFAVGQSIYGQLGCGERIQYTRYPKIIRKLQKLIVQKLVCGQYHSFALTADGRLYSWGWGTHGQLGHGDTETLYEPKRVRYFRRKPVVDVSAGYCHSIVLDADGVVYSFGSNVYGQLGSADDKLKKRNLPEPIYLIEEKISLISSKYFQCLAYCADSRTIYYFGTSPQNSQLVAQQMKKMRSTQQQQQQLNGDAPDAVALANQCTQTKEHKTPRKFEVEYEVRKLETGNLHCMLLTADGRVYSWGRGPEGQLGHGSEKSIVVPTQVQLPDCNNKIVDIACGYDFSLCVSADGELYSFGQNIDHQLGFLTKPEPKSSSSLSNVNSILDSKKLKFKGKKVLTILSSKQVEKTPVRVEFSSERKDLAYLDSVQIDFTTLKAQKKKRRSCDRMLRLKDDLEFSNFSLSTIIYKLRHQLDLRLILNTCLSLESHLCCGFIYELLKEPLNALQFYLKAAFASEEAMAVNGGDAGDRADANNADANNANGHSTDHNAEVKEILNYFTAKYMTKDQATFKQLIVRFADIWLSKRTLPELETVLIEVYEQKVNNFGFGLFLFELMEADGLEAVGFSNEFKIRLMKVTCEYLKSAKINAFMGEPASSLLSSIGSNQNVLSEKTATKLWKSLVNEINKGEKARQSATKNGLEANRIDESSADDSNETAGIEIIPDDNQMYIFSCTHHFSKDYFSSILLKQLGVISSDLNGDADHESTLKTNGMDQMNFKGRCPLCSTGY